MSPCSFRFHFCYRSTGAVLIALACLFLPSERADAQPGRAPHKDASDATTHSRVSDGDRVFMRSAVGLLIHDRRLAELAGTRGGSAEARQFSAQWKSKLNRLQIQLEKLAELNRIELPKDMSEVSRARLEAVASQSGPDFDRGLLSYTQASLNEEVKLFRNSIRKMENQEIRHWAQGALDTTLTQSSAAQRLSSRQLPR